MFCIQCGTNNPDYASFCRLCGRRIEKEDSVPQFPANVIEHPTIRIPQVSQMPSPVAPEHPAIPSGYLAESAPPYRFPSGVAWSAPSPVAQPSLAFDIVPPASEVFYAADAETVSTDRYPEPPQMPISDAGLLDGAYMDMPTAPPPLMAPARPSRFKEMAKPLPLWAFIGTILVVAGLLIVLQLTGADWAVGAYHVAIAAGIIALLIALAAGIRSFAGMAARSNPKRVAQFASAGVAILLLLALCLVGFTQQATIHGLQAHNFEGQQQWQSALNEYQLAGETAPTSDNLARVYNEWGEQLTAQKHFEQAFTKFDVVLNSYGSLKDGVKRAHEGKIAAYLGWAKQAADQRDYATATTRYDQLLQLDYCDVSCQTQANALDATAYYNLAESELAAQNYDVAVDNFATLLVRFPGSPEATKLHGDYAKSLFAKGQQQLATSCQSAIPTYQQLSTQFSDTPEGKQATTALNAPQPVKGRLIGFVPQSPSLTDIAALLKGLVNGITANQFYAMLKGSPMAIIQSDGSFTFKPLPQGTYDLAWGSNNTDGAQSYSASFNPDGSAYYVATVGPLCAFDFGDISQDVPVAP